MHFLGLDSSLGQKDSSPEQVLAVLEESGLAVDLGHDSRWTLMRDHDSYCDGFGTSIHSQFLSFSIGSASIAAASIAAVVVAQLVVLPRL